MLAYEDLVSCCLALPPTILPCVAIAVASLCSFIFAFCLHFSSVSLLYYCFGRDVQLVVVVVVAEWWLLPYVREL